MVIGTIVRVPPRACAPRIPMTARVRPGNCGDDISLRFNQPEKLFISLCCRGSAKSSTDCGERRTANRPLVEISPVMPRFNVVIPQVIIRGRAVLTYISSHYYKAPRDNDLRNIVLPLRDQRAHLIGNFNALRAAPVER